MQVRLNISDETGAKTWMSKMFLHSNCTYRHTRGVSNKVKGKRVAYKVFMHCQHQRKTSTPKQAARPTKCSRKQPLLEGLRNKKTSCPSMLKLTVTIPTKKLEFPPLNRCCYLTQLYSHLHITTITP